MGMRLHTPTGARESVHRRGDSLASLMTLVPQGSVYVMGSQIASEDLPKKGGVHSLPRIDSLARSPRHGPFAPGSCVTDEPSLSDYSIRSGSEVCEGVKPEDCVALRQALSCIPT